MSLVSLFLTLPPAVIAAWGTAVLIPYLSALLTPHKGWWTGLVTLVISFLSGLFTAIAQSTSPLHWKAVFGVTLGAWAIAALSHSKMLAGTPWEALLHAAGTRPRAGVPPTS